MDATVNIDQLIDRLNNCFSLIRSAGNVALEQQALIYAGFLTDIQAGKIDFGAPETEMMGLIEEFCQLIETELVSPK